MVAIGPAPTDCNQPVPATCTGTLIAPRVVVTAAHCFDRPIPFAVAFGPSVDMATETRMVSDVQLHPAYDSATGDNDIAVLVLDRQASAAPVAYATTPLATDAVGRTVRIVGFGADDQAVTGQKLEGTSTITEVSSTSFRTGPAPSMSCGGDSGGPVLDGALLVGLTASGDVGCEQYAVNTDIGAYAADFVDPAVAAAATGDGPDAGPACNVDPPPDGGGCRAGGGTSAATLVLVMALGLVGRRRRLRA